MQKKELTTQQKQALTKQYIAFAGAFVLSIPVFTLTLYLFNGSMKPFSLFLTLPFLYIGISSVKNKVSIWRFRGKRPSGEGAVIIGTIIIVVVSTQYLMSLSQLLEVSTKTNNRWANFPTYEILPIVHSQSDTYYHIKQPSAFFHINTFENINSWSNYQEIPLIVNGNSVIVAGSVGGEGGVNLPLLNVDIDTGKVNWQTVVGSGHITSDGRYIYAQIPDEPSGRATGVTAYDMASGSKIWEATLNWRYAIGISYLATTEDHVIVQTFHRGKNGFYLLDPQTGETQLFDDYDRYFLVDAGTSYEWHGNSISANGALNWETNLPNDRFLYNRELGCVYFLLKIT